MPTLVHSHQPPLIPSCFPDSPARSQLVFSFRQKWTDPITISIPKLLVILPSFLIGCLLRYLCEEKGAAWSDVVQILGLLKTWFTPLRLRYFSHKRRCSALMNGSVRADHICTLVSRLLSINDRFGFIPTWLHPSTQGVGHLFLAC